MRAAATIVTLIYGNYRNVIFELLNFNKHYTIVASVSKVG